MTYQERIAVISEDLALPTDEGLKKFVYSVGAALRTLADVSIVSSQPSGPVDAGVTVARANLLMRGRELQTHLHNFQPSVLIYVPRSGGTRNAFIRSAQLGGYASSAINGMVILQSRTYGRLAAAVARKLSPNVLLTQGSRAQNELERIGLRTGHIPSGVDSVRFSPASRSEKQALRTHFSIPPEAQVVLHVGHLKPERNVLLLARLQSEGMHCIAVGSTSTDQDQSVSKSLEMSSVQVVSGYVENIADIYRCADCYLFPVHHAGNAIEMPLSVLEALACGVPVVTTRFGSLPEWLPASDVVRFGDSDDALVGEVRAVLSDDRSWSETARAQAEKFSWESVAYQVLDQFGANRAGIKGGARTHISAVAS